MIRIWNERNQSIGGVGAAVVIATLKTNGIHAEMGEAEFANHEGVFVKEEDRLKADRIVCLHHGRPG